MNHLRVLRFGAVSILASSAALLLVSCLTAGAADGSGGAAASAPSNGVGGGALQGVSGGLGVSGSSNGLPTAGSGGMSVTASGGTGPGNPGTSGSSGTPPAGAGGAAPQAQCSDTPPNNGDTCAHAVEYGWCSQSWLGDSCQSTCKKCTSGSGTPTGGGGATGSAGSGSTATAGSSGTQTGTPQPPISGGSPGWMSRYWDCCKPACAWSGNSNGKPMPTCSGGTARTGADAQSACDGGGAYMCYDFQPWAVDSYLSYGFAAASGSNYQCGACYEVQFDGSSHTGSPASGAKGKTMIVQVINNGGVGADQFDLLLAGGGVGEKNACTKEWPGADLGSTYGGLLDACNGDVSCFNDRAQKLFSDKPEMLAGATWFSTWLGAAGNPTMVFKKVSCPAALTAKSGMGG